VLPSLPYRAISVYSKPKAVWNDDPAGGGGYAPPTPDPTRARGLPPPWIPRLCAAIASDDPLAPPELA